MHFSSRFPRRSYRHSTLRTHPDKIIRLLHGSRMYMVRMPNTLITHTHIIVCGLLYSAYSIALKQNIMFNVCQHEWFLFSVYHTNKNLTDTSFVICFCVCVWTNNGEAVSIHFHEYQKGFPNALFVVVVGDGAIFFWAALKTGLINVVDR